MSSWPAPDFAALVVQDLDISESMELESVRRNDVICDFPMR
jgi:hypothetical protein